MAHIPYMSQKIFLPLATWLLENAKEFHCEPVSGMKKYGSAVLNGWYIPTSGEGQIFWVCEEDRAKVQAKYLSPPGKGLLPILLMPQYGLVSKLNLTSEVLQGLEQDGLVLVEGFKGALALASIGFNVCTIGGCNGGAKTLEILSNWGISPHWVKKVFADTDILTNPQVRKGYQDTLKKCSPDTEVLVYPPQNIISNTGAIFCEKYSPDDWIEEGDNMEIALGKVQMVNLKSIEGFHKDFLKKFQNIDQRSGPNKAANEWLLSHLDGRLIYISESSQFYYYIEEGYWKTLGVHTLLDRIISNVANGEYAPFTYSVLENSLKLLAPAFLRDQEKIFPLFSDRKYIGFQNGVWDLDASLLLEPRPKHYISGNLSFSFSSVDPTQSLQTLCPKICEWIVDRANREEIYANILIAFLLLAVLDARNPERFLFLSGYSATGKSTYLKLLEQLVPENKCYVSTAENLSSSFGLQELTGISKTLLICHDIGGTVSSAFVNLLRNLVSSGESQHVQRKFERAALMRFEGLVVLASNKNPFTQQQREGILDRRMIYVPFTNRVSASQRQDFDSLFPALELKKFASFAVQQSSATILEFIRVINEDILVRQTLLESFQDSPKSLYIQSFIQRRIMFCKKAWVPLGNPENSQTELTLYGGYLKYTIEQGAKKMDILSYNAFRQEFLPLINRLHPQWEVFERRRIYSGKRVFGILNIQITTDTSEDSEIFSVPLDLFRAAPFWVRTGQDLPVKESEQGATTDPVNPSDPVVPVDGQPAEEEAQKTEIGSEQAADPVNSQPEPTQVDPVANPANPSDSVAMLASGSTGQDIGSEPESQRTGIISEERLKNIQSLLMNVPNTSEEPEVLIQPEVGVVQNLFQLNPVIALDTEFYKDKLAYIQIGFLHTNQVCIFTYKESFTGFAETFFSWLKGNVAILGFFMIVDLRMLWRQFQTIAAGSEILLYKVFDLYVFFKFVHNGFKNHNSLKNWAYRICKIQLEKSHQKTNWFTFTTPLDAKIREYLKRDVWTLHQLLFYVQEIPNSYSTNSWTNEKHFYFETSYRLDQVLIPLFLDIFLQGLSVSMDNLEKANLENEQLRTETLSKLGLDLDIYRSSKKFTDFMRSTMHPISALADTWPKTKTGYLKRGKKELVAWMTKHTANPQFKKMEIIEWFTNFFTVAQADSLAKFTKNLKKHVKNNRIHPLWDLMGADTGRITTSNPPLHSTPRDSSVRSIIVPSKPGNVFGIFDYKTIELVIQAVLADETAMQDVCNNGLDLHIYLASKVRNQSYDQLMALKQTDAKQFKQIRSSMKPVNFGKVYGMGARTLWRRFLSLGENKTFDEVQALHAKWDPTFPEIRTYQVRSKSLYDSSNAPLPRLNPLYN